MSVRNAYSWGVHVNLNSDDVLLHTDEQWTDRENPLLDANELRLEELQKEMTFWLNKATMCAATRAKRTIQQHNLSRRLSSVDGGRIVPCCAVLCHVL